MTTKQETTTITGPLERLLDGPLLLAVLALGWLAFVAAVAISG